MTNQAVGLNNYATGENSRFPELWRGCVGAWAMCLGPTGTRLFDFSGRQNWGTLTNMDAATDWIVSGGQYALDFDGVNDFVEVPFRFNSTGVVSFWYRGTTDTGAAAIYLGDKSNTGTEIYLGNGVTGSLTNELICFSNDAGALGRLYGYTTATRTELYDGNFHHIAVALRQVNTAPEIYLDGVSKTVSAGNNSLASWAIGIAGGTTLQFGAQNFSNTNSGFLTGQLDDIRIYSRALSESEIRLLASKRGIAYECRRRRRVNEQVAALNAIYATRQTQLIGGGLL